MPNRLLKDSIKRSDEIDSLSWFQEVCFYRLMVTVDDNGCYYANPQILKSDLFPTKDDLTKAAIAEALDKLESVGLIRRYEVEGKSYLFLCTWAEHQRIRNKTKHFPDPPETSCGESRRIAANCGELPQNAALIQESKNPRIQESNTDSSEPPEATHEPEPAEPAVYQIILNDKSYFGVTRAMIDEFQALYPAVDVEQEIRNMIGWSSSNPTKRKTLKGIRRFINNWLAREQDSGRGKGPQKQNPIVDFTQYASEG